MNLYLLEDLNFKINNEMGGSYIVKEIKPNYYVTISQWVFHSHDIPEENDNHEYYISLAHFANESFEEMSATYFTAEEPLFETEIFIAETFQEYEASVNKFIDKAIQVAEES